MDFPGEEYTNWLSLSNDQLLKHTDEYHYTICIYALRNIYVAPVEMLRMLFMIAGRRQVIKEDYEANPLIYEQKT